jgi:hypothetical protein
MTFLYLILHIPSCNNYLMLLLLNAST